MNADKIEITMRTELRCSKIKRVQSRNALMLGRFKNDEERQILTLMLLESGTELRLLMRLASVSGLAQLKSDCEGALRQ